jgi:asparagine N-glycosylation enzyme membrane subunit Stt3
METKPEMPRVAMVGVALLGLEWLVSNVATALGWVPMAEGQEGGSWATMIGSLAGSLLWALLIYLIATGRRWALLVSISLFLLGTVVLLIGAMAILGIIPLNLDMEPLSLADSLWTAFSLLFLLTGYSCLLTKPSRAWFAAWRKRRKRPTAWEVAW